MEKKIYIVKRQHHGDQPYSSGDERQAEEADVQHLIDSGVLEEKTEPKVKNKAKRAPKNKAG